MDLSGGTWTEPSKRAAGRTTVFTGGGFYQDPRAREIRPSVARNFPAGAPREDLKMERNDAPAFFNSRRFMARMPAHISGSAWATRVMSRKEPAASERTTGCRR